MKKNNRFGRNGCFHCRICDKLTRDTGNDNGAVELCPLCNEICLYENSLSDNGWGRHGDLENCQTIEEVHERFTELQKKNEANPIWE